MYGFSYPGRADHLQRYRITFNFPDVPIDLVRGETYILTLLLVRHVRQDQSLPCTAFQWHPAIGEDLSPPDSKLEKMIVASRLIYIYISLFHSYDDERIPCHANRANQNVHSNTDTDTDSCFGET